MTPVCACGDLLTDHAPTGACRGCRCLLFRETLRSRLARIQKKGEARGLGRRGGDPRGDGNPGDDPGDGASPATAAGPGPSLTWWTAAVPAVPPFPRPATDVPVRQHAGTLKGWKRARLAVRGDGEAVFTGLHVDLPYRAESTAVCARPDLFGYGFAHPAGEMSPARGCSCGFYALKDRQMLNHAEGGRVTLEVELWGRVICYTHGYRAQHQRVLSVRVDRICPYCGNSHRTPFQIGYGIPVPPATANREVALWMAPGGSVFTACHDCAAGGVAQIQPSDLTNILGVETRWAT